MRRIPVLVFRMPRRRKSLQAAPSSLSPMTPSPTTPSPPPTRGKRSSTRRLSPLIDFITEDRPGIAPGARLPTGCEGLMRAIQLQALLNLFGEIVILLRLGDRE